METDSKKPLVWMVEFGRSEETPKIALLDWESAANWSPISASSSRAARTVLLETMAGAVMVISFAPMALASVKAHCSGV